MKMDETVKTHAKPIIETFDVEVVALPSLMDNRPAFCAAIRSTYGEAEGESRTTYTCNDV